MNEKMKRFSEAGLYVVLTRAFCGGRETLDVLRAVLDAGVTLVQIREKDAVRTEALRIAREARRLTERAHALLIVNDCLEAALDSGADGLHLGQDDMPIADARAAAPHLILGASTHSTREAIAAQTAGASYINIGPIFPTRTKTLAMDALGLDGLQAIAPTVTVPFTVMGGIKQHHIPSLAAVGARIVAVVTAVTAAADPGRAAADLLTAIRQCVPRRPGPENK